ncbi:2,4-dienoyl-CoA reductase (NADPH) [Starmerella bacillaris]|uniref:2,4-dienoyl-CoA reductase (NADPH) n=1 Tax=Starmerella bacillaris TaxID=1247836 RepID=A0AAV5RPD9_STABA|nr:2,4-dienoyl-CoA reductase (NADPH) [Starmerella bacillaris]
MPKNFSDIEYPAKPPATATDESLTILDLFKLTGKVASITGSSSGIGLGIAEAFAQAGADVAIWYSSHDATEIAEKLSKKYGVRAKAYKCAIDNEEQVKNTIHQQIKDFGHLDIVVSNAGICWTKGQFIDQPDNQHFHDVMNVDFNGSVYVSKYAGQHFRERWQKTGKKGSLIFTSSMSGHIVNVPQLQATYNAAKAAVRHFAKSLAVEWAPWARVNSVSPGYINTPIAEFCPEELQNQWWALTPLGRPGEVKELVGIYLYLASDASSYTTGTDIIVDGGTTLP